MGALPKYMSVHMCTEPAEARRGCLDLELQIIVSSHVDVENQTWVLGKSGKCS